MKRAIATAGLFVLLLGAAVVAHALDYVSVDSSSAILYQADSLNARKLYVVSRYTPLEKVVNSGTWVKVRDSGGSMGWVEKRVLSSKRYVVVTAERASVRQAPDAGAAVVFQVVQNVALEWLGAGGGGWARVRHQDGASGFIRSTEVWGDE